MITLIWFSNLKAALCCWDKINWLGHCVVSISYVDESNLLIFCLRFSGCVPKWGWYVIFLSYSSLVRFWYQGVRIVMGFYSLTIIWGVCIRLEFLGYLKELSDVSFVGRFFLTYFRERERERERGRERGRVIIPSGLHTDGVEPSTGLELTEPWDRDLSQNQESDA